MPTITIEAATHSGVIKCSDVDIAPAWSGNGLYTTTVFPTLAEVGISHPSSYDVRRAFMAFDTSSITVIPASATLNLYTYQTTNFIVGSSIEPGLNSDLVGSLEAFIEFYNYPYFSDPTPGTGATGSWTSISLNYGARERMMTSPFQVTVSTYDDLSNLNGGGSSQDYGSFDMNTGNLPYIEYMEGNERKVLKLHTNQIDTISKIFNVNISNIYNLYGKVLHDPPAYVISMSPTAELGSGTTQSSGTIIVNAAPITFTFSAFGGAGALEVDRSNGWLDIGTYPGANDIGSWTCSATAYMVDAKLITLTSSNTHYATMWATFVGSSGNNVRIY